MSVLFPKLPDMPCPFCGHALVIWGNQPDATASCISDVAPGKHCIACWKGYEFIIRGTTEVRRIEAIRHDGKNIPVPENAAPVYTHPPLPRSRPGVNGQTVLEMLQ